MSSAMDSLMSTVDTITSADSDAPCTACTSPVETPVGFVAKSPPSSPKDGKLASSGVTTTSAALALPPGPPGSHPSSSPPGTTSSLLTTSSSKHLVQSSPTNTASSLKTRSLDGLLLGPAPVQGAPHHRGLDATSTTTTVSDVSSGRGGRGSTSDENAFLFLGCVQALLGILMVVFGVLAMLHRASMASVGAGVWGGAISFVSGVAGVIAGLRSCYSSSVRGGSGSGRPPIAPTVFMALSLVALAVSNLVLVLAAIGLVRDARTPDIQLLREEEDAEEEEPRSSPGSSHWERVLASCGLLLAAGLQLLAAIASGYRCYRLVCPCAARTSRKHSPLYNQRSSGGSPDSLHSVSGLYSSGSKERLVSRWLTRQVPNGPLYTGSPTPSGLLLFSTQPPPPAGRDGRTPGFTAISPGHHAQTVYTLTQPPSPGPPFMATGVPTYPGGMSYYPHYMGPVVGPVGHPRARYHQHHRQHRQQHVPTLPSDERLRRERRHRGEKDADKPRAKPKPKAVTEADVARTYTGLDRRIAEEFIMAMDSRQAAGVRDAAEAARVD
ncbi:uncharacterized protein LOC113211618 isoform X2 [Frankliniella occidentalis]|uniref:Uncharacterized protein LOC113211618 isoform X2 n=1 Tax=Frankliniella occidentalis TaxID=133901 RepID=A0A9C6UCD9_FRAOC|nr:uncharacterized protein LOC113211618 isoform X2 [Frankliniella occidentalis]